MLFWSDLSILPTQAYYLDFIRAGAIYHDVFKSDTTKEKFLKSYVKKDIMPDIKFMESEDFSTTLAQIKTLFD